MISPNHNLLCKTSACVEADACIKITINEDGDAFGASLSVIRNYRNMEVIVDCPIH
jgi:hypothetical protein